MTLCISMMLERYPNLNKWLEANNYGEGLDIDEKEECRYFFSITKDAPANVKKDYDKWKKEIDEINKYVYTQ